MVTSLSNYEDEFYDFINPDAEAYEASSTDDSALGRRKKKFKKTKGGTSANPMIKVYVLGVTVISYCVATLIITNITFNTLKNIIPEHNYTSTSNLKITSGIFSKKNVPNTNRRGIQQKLLPPPLPPPPKQHLRGNHGLFFHRNLQILPRVPSDPLGQHRHFYYQIS